ncbi:family 34 putative glycosyltransferase [Naviculisporaceae sp. PSN 640]
MHFAYPPRKSSNPQPYLPRGASKLPTLRRSRLKVIALAGLAFFALIWLITRAGGSRGVSRRKPTGNPPAVILTVIDEKKYSKGYIETIKENRIQYAEKHGYQVFFPSAEDYDLKKAPASWASVVASRHALTKYPETHFVWFLDQNSFIMNPDFRIEQHIMAPAKIESLMKKDQPVVPPDSIIKTFSHLKGSDVDFVVTQDKDGLSVGSFIVRNGEWAEFMLETWFDPIYRSYNFQRAETHALEHIVQWHPTILAKMAIVEQNILNAYSTGKQGEEYKDGDLVVRFPDCAAAGAQACETEAQKFTPRWRAAFQSS